MGEVSCRYELPYADAAERVGELDEGGILLGQDP